MTVNSNSNVQLFKLLRGLENAGKYQPAKPDSIPHLQETLRDSRSSFFNCKLKPRVSNLD